MFVVTLLISVGESSATSQKKVIDSTLRSAEKNSQMAINFHQGNHDSLIDAQGYFTPDGKIIRDTRLYLYNLNLSTMVNKQPCI